MDVDAGDGRVPASGRVRVVRTRTAVVLPAPFGPRTQRIVPSAASKSRPASAWVSPKDLWRPTASIMALGITTSLAKFALRHPARLDLQRRRHTCPMARVAVVFTGGTISMRHDPGAGGNLPALRGEELLASVPGLPLSPTSSRSTGAWCPPLISRSTSCSRSAGSLTNSWRARDRRDGRGAGHGHHRGDRVRVGPPAAPGQADVVVGAMRSASQEAYDGPENLRNAVAAAADPPWRSRGGGGHGGRASWRRRRSQDPHARTSPLPEPECGPPGLVADGRVTLLRRRSPVRLAHLPDHGAATHRCRSWAPPSAVDRSLGSGARGPGRGGSGWWKHAAVMPRARTTAHR